MSDSLEDPQLQAALVANYNAYAEGLDSKNWPLVRSCFADQVMIDYGAISAPSGPPEIARAADDWLSILQSVINGFDITRHIITNHRFLQGADGPRCRAYLSADHVVFDDPALPVAGPQQLVTVVGEYTNTYARVDGRWRICHSELRVDYSTGNVALFERATERAAALNQRS